MAEVFECNRDECPTFQRAVERMGRFGSSGLPSEVKKGGVLVANCVQFSSEFPDVACPAEQYIQERASKFDKTIFEEQLNA